MCYNKYISRFSYKNKSYWVGTFDTEIEAALAYNKKILEICGNDAIINKFLFKN
jgi:hypothetical protein